MSGNSVKTTKTFKVPAAEIQQRGENVQKQLQLQDIGGLFIVQRVDLFYFSGTAQNGFLFMPAEGEPVLFIRQYYPRAREESSIKNIIEIKSITEIPGLISDMFGKIPPRMGFELDVLPVNDFNYYRQLFGKQEYVDGSPIILNLRMIKSDWEIRQMEKTAELARKTYEHMQTVIQPGLTEMEFAGIAEAYARKIGHQGKIRTRHYQTEGYPWHFLSGNSGGMVGLLDAVASGEGTSPAFPAGAGSKKLHPNEPIMVDMGLVLNGYHLDETRMLAIGGMPDRAMQASRTAIEIHNRVIDRAKPGIAVRELFEYSVNLAQSLGYAENYLGPPGHKVSFIGHGIGLEIVEPPFVAKNRKDLLKPGMTFALEPKMLYEKEFAAGIESVFVVTDTGARLISKVPVEVFIC
ncbi:MAG: aminopeptidase P family protein [Deltaproteobacteria bacterium]|jgi:Xaa-Pro aminopeptidase|nr:aminopeptidase P family protein [Deltaproteobacteria bacterium]